MLCVRDRAREDSQVFVTYLVCRLDFKMLEEDSVDGVTFLEFKRESNDDQLVRNVGCWD